MKQVVDVVAFIVPKNGKILVEKRKSSARTDPSKITIPGGHVEEGEALEQACKRELKEELDIECDKFEFIVKFLHCTDIEGQMTYFYSCKDWKGIPKCREAEEVFWVDPGQLDVLSFEIDRKAAKEFFKKRL